jgi:hypothetical protein
MGIKVYIERRIKTGSPRGGRERERERSPVTFATGRSELIVTSCRNGEEEMSSVETVKDKDRDGSEWLEDGGMKKYQNTTNYYHKN